jgi:lysophospholipase L1-like esterase
MKQRKRPSLLALSCLGGALLLVASGCAVWQVGKSIDLAKRSEPWQQAPDRATMRLLIVGDSTAVGTGASLSARSLGGLIGQSHPRLLIENRARDGARFSEVAEQLGGSDRFDAVLVQAGGNDVIRLRRLDSLQADVANVAELARRRADWVLLMPSGNVGNAPFFFPPVSWLMTHRSRALHRFVEDAAARTGAVYVNLFHERAVDPFVIDKALNASDGLHPSDAGYAVWLRALLTQSDLAHRLNRAAGRG